VVAIVGAGADDLSRSDRAQHLNAAQWGRFPVFRSMGSIKPLDGFHRADERFQRPVGGVAEPHHLVVGADGAEGERFSPRGLLLDVNGELAEAFDRGNDFIAGPEPSFAAVERDAVGGAGEEEVAG